MLFFVRPALSSVYYRLLLVAIFLPALAIGADAETQENSGSGQSGVILDAQAQRRLGLQTVELQVTHYTPELIAYGIVQDLQPLLDLRNRYFVARANKQMTSAHLQQTRQSLARAAELARDGIVAQSKLQAQQAQWQAEQAQAAADRYQIEALCRNAERQWGKKLADWALADKSSPLLLPNYKVLIVTLPREFVLTSAIDTIYADPSGERTHAQRAELVSPAPQSSGIPGETYFFSSTDARLRIGMRVTTWMAQARGGQTGVLVPPAAVVWHLGQAFVYLQNQPDRFERRAIDTTQHDAQGYFVPAQLAAGDKLVVTGAQALLSEEFRTQIPSEDDD